jgi:uncharacterized membrane protein YcaP (DUF421 family)
MFFRSWADVLRVVIAASLLFVLIVTVLRVIGQQALAKMSGYDVVVTVTIGSILAAVALTREITIVEGVAALVTLVGLQETTRWLQARWPFFHHAVRESPRVVLWDGMLLEDRLRASSVSADEVRAAVRRNGFRSLSDVRIVVLENDGEWSVVPKSAAPSDESAFFGLPIPGRVWAPEPIDVLPLEEAERVAPNDRVP